MSKNSDELFSQYPAIFMFHHTPTFTSSGEVKQYPLPAEGERVLPKLSKVTPISHGGKRRGRPVIPFRLPTPAEVAESRAGAGSSSMSTSPPKSTPFTGDTFLPSSAPLGGLALEPADHGLLASFRSIQHHDSVDWRGVPVTKRGISSKELESYIDWIRSEIPTIFWTRLHEKFIQTKQLDETHVKNRAWIEVVHEPATNAATKFMQRFRDRITPLDYMKMDDEEEDETENVEPEGAGSQKTIGALGFLKKLMTGILLSSDKQKGLTELNLDEIFEKFYHIGIRALIGNHILTANPEVRTTGSENECHFCEEAPCNCPAMSEAFQNANVALHSLGLMGDIAGPRLYIVIHEQIALKIQMVGTEKFDASNIEALKYWLTEESRAWYTALYTRDARGELITEVPEEFGQELWTLVLRVYGNALIKDLFAIIIEFPESKPLLDDLRTCMKQVNLRNHLVSELKSSLERRLLNAGVNTSEVLEAYIATVRALKHVDPTGILVQLVTPPVREYLKRREETVRVILISLTEEAGELSEELARNPTNPDKTCKLTLQNYEQWNPDPIDVPKDKHNLRKSDLIEAMVSIYGSKTVFIDEYRALLADRLLRMSKPGAITREIKCLELLKLRFGEADLQKCEVMLKDVSDSQRLNTRFYEDDGAVLKNEAMQVSAFVVSAQFWPSLKQEDIVLPDPVTAALEKYTKAFEMIKGNRTLEWQKHIGTVKLEIEHGGIKANFSVSPIQATIIWHFQEQEKWSLDELAKVTGTTSSYISSRIGFWVSKGMIIHTGQGNYMLADAIQESSKATGVIPNKYMEEGDTDSPMASTSSQRATELQVFWSYIEAMLTNLESLPLARIHSMLKLFATVECSSEELQKFLDDKVSQNLLVYSAGQYQLPK